jgi:UDP-N-acetylglucosamine--N-acetylmuramyl-(pentapeptide) pyrophosphoryl-undecaprenol N-acetylglucosamine transferase
MLLVPLSKAASRGDQILNARSFEKQGFAMVLEEEEITDEKLLAAIDELYQRREEFRTRMAESPQSDAVSFVCDRIEEAMKHE